MTARLGIVSSTLVSMKGGLPQGAPESLVIFTLFMEMVLRRFEPTWRAIDSGDFSLAAICCADDVVLVANTMDAAKTMVSETIQEMDSTGLTVGAERTHWTSFTRMKNWSTSGRRALQCGKCFSKRKKRVKLVSTKNKNWRQTQDTIICRRRQKHIRRTRKQPLCKSCSHRP